MEESRKNKGAGEIVSEKERDTGRRTESKRG